MRRLSSIFMKGPGKERASQPDDPHSRPMLKYSDLDMKTKCTRFICLHPPDEKDPDLLVCKFQVVRLDISPRPRYTAVSYTWEGQKPTAEHTLLVIDEKGMMKRLQITRNCYDILFRLRGAQDGILKGTKDSQGMIRCWVDAICINQESTVEKVHQMSLMGLLYTHARTVFIWLGRDEEGVAPCAVKCLDRLANTPKIVKNKLLTSYTHLLKPSTEKKNFNVDVPDVILDTIRRSLNEGASRDGHTTLEEEEDDRRGLAAMFSHPWFTRVWTLQELALNSKGAIVVFGSCAIPWSRIQEAWSNRETATPGSKGSIIYQAVGLVSALSAHVEVARTGNYTEERVENSLPPRVRGLDFPAKATDIFQRIRSRNSTDVKDYVFALSGH